MIRSHRNQSEAQVRTRLVALGYTERSANNIIRAAKRDAGYSSREVYVGYERGELDITCEGN